MTVTPAAPARQAPSDLLQSVARALAILEVIGASGGPLSAKQVARRCGLKLATTYHLLRTLCHAGYLTHLPNGDYALGLAIADRFRDLMTALAEPTADEALRALAARTGQSAYLARFVDGRVTITRVAEAPGSPHLEDLIVGFDEAAHATALGKALLSTLSPAARGRYLAAQGMRPFTAATVTDPAALDAEVAQHSPGGVFRETAQYREGVACAAVLVPGRPPEDPWALAVSARAERLHRVGAELVRELRVTARTLVGT